MECACERCGTIKARYDGPQRADQAAASSERLRAAV